MNIIPVLPLPDEALWSWIARIHLRSGNRGTRTTLRRVFSSHRDIWKDLPKPSDPFLEFCAAKLHLAEAKIQASMSLAPLLDHFASAAETRSRRRVKAPTLRACAKCAEEDTKQHGIPFWHRDHETLASLYCCKHRVRLFEWRHPRGNMALELPGMGEYSFDRGAVVAPDVSESFAFKISSLVADALAGCLPPPSSLMSQLQSEIERCGLRKGSRLTRANHSLELIRRSVGSELWGRISRDSARGSRSLVVLSVLRGDGAQTDPIVWLALLSALSVADPASRPPPPANTRRTEFSREAIQEVLPLASRNLNSAAVALGTSRSKLISAMAIYGLSVTYRQTSKSKFLEADVLRMCEMLRAGLPQEEIAHAFGCSTEFLRELVVYFPDVRRAAAMTRTEKVRHSYREVIVRHVDAGLSRLQIRQTAATELDWLTDHDKAWLTEHLPPVRTRRRTNQERRDWNGRDERLAVLCESTADQFYEKDVRGRITVCRILRATKSLGLYSQNVRIGRFPKTQAVLDRRGESLVDYQRRTIARAILELHAAGVPLSMKRLRYATWLAPSVIKANTSYVLERAAALGLTTDQKSAFSTQIGS